MVAGNEGLRRACVRLASWPERTEGSCIDLGALGWAGAAVFHTRADSPGPHTRADRVLAPPGPARGNTSVVGSVLRELP